MIWEKPKCVIRFLDWLLQDVRHSDSAKRRDGRKGGSSFGGSFAPRKENLSFGEMWGGGFGEMWGGGGRWPGSSKKSLINEQSGVPEGKRRSPLVKKDF